MLLSQTTTSRISGSVKDSTGGAVPNAQVTATSQMSKESRTALTDGAGQFVFDTLAAGPYTVKIEIPGFKIFEQKDVPVAADKPVFISSIALQVSEAASSVDVSAKIDPFQVVPKPLPTRCSVSTSLSKRFRVRSLWCRAR